MKNFLFYLLDRYFKDVYEIKLDNEKIEEWLLKQSSEPGMKQYFKKRDWTILKQMGNGVEEKEYWRLVGQRQELLMLLGEVKSAEDRNEKKKKKPINKD